MKTEFKSVTMICDKKILYEYIYPHKVRVKQKSSLNHQILYRNVAMSPPVPGFRPCYPLNCETIPQP